jgi:hypothetical protein
MEFYINAEGAVRFVYGEEVPCQVLATALGSSPNIRRASHVEPTEDGQWTADMAPCDGPILGPFGLRSEALEAETQWLINWMKG